MAYVVHFPVRHANWQTIDRREMYVRSVGLLFSSLGLVVFILSTSLSGQAGQCVDLFVRQAGEVSSAGLSVASLPGSFRGRLLEPTVHLSGESGFMEKVRMIENAKRGDRLDLAYFIYESDYSSAYLTRKAIEKAREGVRFRLIADYFMADKFMDLFRFIQAHENMEVYLFRPPSPEFVKFLKVDLQMADTDLFFQGLVTFNKDKILQAVASSPILGPNLLTGKGLLGQYLQQKKSGEAISPEVAAQVAQEVSALLLSDLRNHLDLRTLRTFRSHLVEFTRRLHHKIMISGSEDAVTFISGGRNISDEYDLSLGHPFLKERNYPFFDLEISGQLRGADARALRNTFDRLLARPGLLRNVSEMAPMSKQELDAYEEALYAKAKQFEEQLPALVPAARAGAQSLKNPLEVTYTENSPSAHPSQKRIVGSLETIFKNAQHEITIISAYAHLTDQMFELAREAVKRGVKIKLYTNSFRSTDMNIVNVASYKKFARWSKELGDAFSLYELQLGAREGSLHAKAIVADDKIVGIGSANFDPRSDRLDSNNFVFFDASQNIGLPNTIMNTFAQKLPWIKVDAAYVNAMLEAIAAKSPILLKMVGVQDIEDQL